LISGPFRRPSALLSARWPAWSMRWRTPRGFQTGCGGLFPAPKPPLRPRWPNAGRRTVVSAFPTFPASAISFRTSSRRARILFESGLSPSAFWARHRSCSPRLTPTAPRRVHIGCGSRGRKPRWGRAGQLASGRCEFSPHGAFAGAASPRRLAHEAPHQRLLWAGPTPGAIARGTASGDWLVSARQGGWAGTMALNLWESLHSSNRPEPAACADPSR